MTFEDAFQFIEAKNAVKRSASRTIDYDFVNVARTYKKTKQASNKVDTELCSYCGTQGNGKQTMAHICLTDCLTFGYSCIHYKCDVQSRTLNHENAVFDDLCALLDANLIHQRARQRW